MLLLLLFFITAGGAWVYWNSPSIDTARPTIEHYLQQELELKELHLGELSWHWSGFLWLNVDRLDFASPDHGISYHNGSASVRIPLSVLFNGEIVPDKIRLQRGILDIQLDNSATAPLLPKQLILDGIQINWHASSGQDARGWHGELADVHLKLNASTRKVDATSPAFNLSAQWDEDGLPSQLNVHCKHTDWLPEPMRQYIKGSPQADITLRRYDKQSWNVEGSITSAQPISMRLGQQGDIYQFNSLTTKLQIQAGNNIKQTDPFSLKQIDIQALAWTLADHHISAKGQWQHGKLLLTADSDQLPMPLIWSWLQPLGDEEWQHWLTLMQHGIAKQASANLSLNWSEPLTSWPNTEAFASMQYQVQAQLEHADIALGVSNGSLRNTRATIDLDQDALVAHIEETTLPKELGHSSGSLRIPLDTLLLHITGTSNADVANLLRWFGPSQVNEWKWNKARANSHFELLWDPSEESPKEARITLQPDGEWNINVLKFPLQLSHGEVQWDQNSGLSLHGMHLSGKHMKGTFSFNAAAKNEVWKITSLQAQGTSDLAPLAAHFQLPMAHAGGTVTSILRFYNGQWSGKLDMTDASWEHLLGSDKKPGERFSLQYHGLLDMKAKLPTIYIDKLTSSGSHIKLHDGAGSINRSGLQMQLNGLHTPSFSGNLKIDVPFADNLIWKIDAKARYLNRNALPDSLDHSEKLIDKNWLLRADIDRFDWDDARMSGVHLRLASDNNSLGIMEAALIHTSQMDIMDVDARFTLPGEGRVELRKFSALFEKQTLTMSATLSPEIDGGMRWKGFAELHGDFGHLMNKGGLSNRFLEGDGRLLFSGQGLILKEQPWWQGLDGRLRMRVNQGRILEGGTLTTLLSAINLSQLPALLLGQRKDLTGPGIMYERLQMEAIMQDQTIHIRNVAMRSSAFDLVGQGNMDVDKNTIDLFLIAKPLQNLDALLSKIPLVRDLLGGRSHSLMRKVYHLSGPFTDAKVKAVRPREAGLSEAGIIERLFNIPNNWFGSAENKPPVQTGK